MNPAGTSTVAGLTTWPVKSMGGGTALVGVEARPEGLAGDRAYGVRDVRAGRDERPLSARSLPGLLRWSAAPGAGEPVVSGPDGRSWSWSQPELAGALSEDLGRPLGLVQPTGGCHDLPRSVLVTTVASHRAVEEAFGALLEPARWRTNILLDGVPPLAEHGWEGRRLLIGDVVLRLLHPCRRCTIPTYAPGGRARTRELLAFFAAEQRPFGINARVEVPGTLELGAAALLD